ncbi:aminopeptidase [Blastocladiella emersonii ATCC 22665]|nr:aminopeptidase [Blastocladiella emersonii ATCC 22665]
MHRFSRLAARSLAVSATRAAPTASRLLRSARRGYAELDRATQPLAHTHGHLFGSLAELTPGITAAEYAARRERLMAQLPSGSAAVLVGNPTTFATQKIFNQFQQNTDFFYMTGLDEPDCVAVFEKDPREQKGYRWTLFVEDRPAHEVRWSGPATGVEAARTVFGADTALPNTAFRGYFRQLQADVAARSGSGAVLYIDPPTSLLSHQLHPSHASSTDLGTRGGAASASWWRTALTSGGTQPAAPTRALSPLVQAMRAVKSSAEIAVMARAGAISGASFADTMARSHTLHLEHTMAAYLEWQFKQRGAKGHAYVPVVAGGSNACILHYVNNDMPLPHNGLVLVDAGCQYAGYASDISRTFPVARKFTDPQRELYQAVLNVQEQIISMISTAVSLDDLHYRLISLMTAELKSLGFDVNNQIVSRELYYHHLGHYLGADVHDTPSVSRAQPLQPGNVITIEPGVYVSPNPRWPARFHGIGIRIEDDVHVTPTGPHVLTALAPKSIADIEALIM